VTTANPGRQEVAVFAAHRAKVEAMGGVFLPGARVASRGPMGLDFEPPDAETLEKIRAYEKQKATQKATDVE
jgi:hypothetical protein